VHLLKPIAKHSTSSASHHVYLKNWSKKKSSIFPSYNLEIVVKDEMGEHIKGERLLEG